MAAVHSHQVIFLAHESVFLTRGPRWSGTALKILLLDRIPLGSCTGCTKVIWVGLSVIRAKVLRYFANLQGGSVCVMLWDFSADQLPLYTPGSTVAWAHALTAPPPPPQLHCLPAGLGPSLKELAGLLNP